MTTSTFTLGRCPKKGCKHRTRSEAEAGRWSAICPDHGAYSLSNVYGEFVETAKCGATCRNAVGPACDCSCGGANHGHAHAA
jgi:hypothetical protein